MGVTDLVLSVGANWPFRPQSAFILPDVTKFGGDAVLEPGLAAVPKGRLWVVEKRPFGTAAKLGHGRATEFGDAHPFAFFLSCETPTPWFG
jgi:hypothetical protein